MKPAAPHTCKRPLTVAAALVQLLLASTALHAAPPIRTGDSNRMPACVAPDRLMAFLHDRNPDLDPKYRDIAKWYKQWGDTWRVRWDYAFFQMVIETNYLKYRRGNGRRGDVHENQFNFAGLGATGGGVAGNRFPDVKTGVLAQIQHLVAYSGEKVVKPVAPRTELAQDSIVEQSRRLKRPVTYSDLARRWAADRKYGKTIDFVAEQFFANYCKGPATIARAGTESDAPARAPERRMAKPAGLGGPKPQMLAGPETMPWVDGINTAQENSGGAGVTTPAKKRAPENVPEKMPEKSGPPVRTIWSREKGFEVHPEAAKSETAKSETAKSNAAIDPAEMPPVVAEPSPPDAAIPDTITDGTAKPQQSAATVDIEPVLPTFRIAPSRLGGPVDPVTPLKEKTAEIIPAAAAIAPPAAKPARPPPKQAALAVLPKPQPAPIGPCRILTASYGGKKTLLVKASRNGGTELTALSVVDGFEQSMFATYAKASAPAAELVSEHASKDEAIAAANTICAGG